MTQRDTIGRPRPGAPAPLGAHWDGEGTNFAIYSRNASAVTLCLYDEDAAEPFYTIDLGERTRDVWHVYLPGVHAGTRYGYRLDGEYRPEQGQRFNPHKMMLDPYGKGMAGDLIWNPAVFAYDVTSQDDDTFDERPNDAFVPRSVVVGGEFSWDGDRRPNVPWNESIIYELHVKGFTECNPAIPARLRGTWLGVSHEASIEYLRSLGVTTVELLPPHAFVDDQFLMDKDLRNYWGYSTLNYFTPEPRYAESSDPLVQVSEFRRMVKELHSAGIEVIIDVVYNHTCEGNHLGPSLSWRGVDNATYYRLLPDNPRHYIDYTGTGNSLDVANPQTLKLVLDSLRYWVDEMHVDGFRFDLAVTLGREWPAFDAGSGFFDAIHQDPTLSMVKLIAEPWDIGPRGYQTGHFPILWSEWNDRFRDDVREWWLQGGKDRATMAYRMAGSSDIFGDSGRGPRASINFIVAHDGFTLRDVVSYSEKHNKANKERNEDGHDHNHSANFGVEGPTKDPEINELRSRMQRNLLASLLLAQGVPMIAHGDEVNRTQNGNNNAYAQDNELTWMDWVQDENDEALYAFTSRMTELRKKEPLLRRRRYFRGQPDHEAALKDITWLKPDGTEMAHEDWTADTDEALIFRLSGTAIDEPDEFGGEIRTSSLLVVMHRGAEMTEIVLPDPNGDTDQKQWELVVTTDTPDGDPAEESHDAGARLSVPARTVMVLRGTDD